MLPNTTNNETPTTAPTPPTNTYTRHLATTALEPNSAFNTMRLGNAVLTIGTSLAGGQIWDDKLNKFASWNELVHHPNSTMAHQLEQSSINKFAPLFQG